MALAQQMILLPLAFRLLSGKFVRCDGSNQIQLIDSSVERRRKISMDGAIIRGVARILSRAQNQELGRNKSTPRSKILIGGQIRQSLGRDLYVPHRRSRLVRPPCADTVSASLPAPRSTAFPFCTPQSGTASGRRRGPGGRRGRTGRPAGPRSSRTAAGGAWRAGHCGLGSEPAPSAARLAPPSLAAAPARPGRRSAPPPAAAAAAAGRRRAPAPALPSSGSCSGWGSIMRVRRRRSRPRMRP